MELEAGAPIAQVEICRTCANYIFSSQGKYVDVFQEKNEEVEFLLKLLGHWNVSITPNDGLPGTICSDCYTKFSTVNLFRQDCVEADKKLHAALSHEAVASNNNNDNNNNYNNFNHNDNLLDAVDKVTASFVAGPGLLAPGTSLMNELMSDITSTDLQNFNMYAQNITGPTLEQPATATANGSEPVLQYANGEPLFFDTLEQTLQGITTKLEQDEVGAQDSPVQRQPQVLQMEREEEESGSEDEDTTVSTALDARLQGKPYTCQYCYCSWSGPVEHLVFSTAEALSQHFFDVHDPNHPYNCPHCHQDYSSAKLRDKHVRLMHAHAFPDQTCVHCHKTVRTAMEVHQLNCSGLGNFTCATCHEQFVGRPFSEFVRHERLHKPAKDYECHDCGRKFVRRSHFEAHERLHLEGKAGFTCNECSKSFKSKSDLRHHKYAEHRGAMPATCETCNKDFASPAFLKRHIRNFHPKGEKGVAMRCHTCDTEFTSMLKLRNHLQRARDSNVSCAELQLTARELREQREQREEREAATQPCSSEGIFFCPICPQRFDFLSQRERHLEEHRGMPHTVKCDSCDLLCRSTHEVSRHMELVHFQLKSHSCDECQQQFSSKRNLREHEIFHSRVSVRCPEKDCAYKFQNGPTLKAHIQKRHDLLACPYCGDLYTPQWLNDHLQKEHFITSD